MRHSFTFDNTCSIQVSYHLLKQKMITYFLNPLALVVLFCIHVFPLHVYLFSILIFSLPRLFLLHPFYLYMFLSFEDLQTEIFCLFYKVAIFLQSEIPKAWIFFYPPSHSSHTWEHTCCELVKFPEVIVNRISCALPPHIGYYGDLWTCPHLCDLLSFVTTLSAL